MKITVADKLTYLFVKRSVKKIFCKKLSGKLPGSTVLKLPEEIWNEYKIRLTGLEKKETFGATLMVRLSLLTLILYEKLISENIEKQEAIRLTSEITWLFYDKLTGVFWIFTWLFSRKPIERVKKAISFSIRYFPYNSPGYEMEIINMNDNEISHNVYKCLAAEFFKEHKLSELCAKTWCDLDYSLADKWNVKLERDKTIAKGDELCTFRFIGKND